MTKRNDGIITDMECFGEFTQIRDRKKADYDRFQLMGQVAFKIRDAFCNYFLVTSVKRFGSQATQSEF